MENKLPIGLRQPWQWEQPRDDDELLARLRDAFGLAVHERERENLCSVAYGRIKKLLETVAVLSNERDRLSFQRTALDVELRERDKQLIVALAKIHKPIDIRGEICKIITEMLDNPDETGIYPTTRCYNELEKLVDNFRYRAEAAEHNFAIEHAALAQAESDKECGT